MAWACMAASKTDLLIFIGNATHDGGSRINYKVYRNILSANLLLIANWVEILQAARQ